MRMLACVRAWWIGDQEKTHSASQANR
jgi:hypothetical protein